MRHLILPSCRQDSEALLRALHAEFGSHAFLLSLMSQYTPEFADPDADKPLHRRLTSFEYDAVCRAACELGFDGFTQNRTSACVAYTPSFTEENF